MNGKVKTEQAPLIQKGLSEHKKKRLLRKIKKKWGAIRHLSVSSRQDVTNTCPLKTWHLQVCFTRWYKNVTRQEIHVKETWRAIKNYSVTTIKCRLFMPRVYLAAEHFSNQLEPLKTYLKKIKPLVPRRSKNYIHCCQEQPVRCNSSSPKATWVLLCNNLLLHNFNRPFLPRTNTFLQHYYHHWPVAVPLSLCSSAPVTGCALFGFAPGAAGEGGPAPPPRSMQDGGGGCPRFSNTLWSCWQRNRGGTSRGM